LLDKGQTFLIQKPSNNTKYAGKLGSWRAGRPDGLMGWIVPNLQAFKHPGFPVLSLSF
jgi:hypothetical protein